MPTFIITAHIELAGIGKPVPPQQPIQTGLIRLEIPADNIEEARLKAQEFIQRKTAIIIDSSEEKPVEPEPEPPKKSFQEAMMDTFKNWKKPGE